MTKEEENAFRMWQRFYLIVLIIAIIVICFCSCTDHEHCNRHFETGVVEKVEKNHTYTKYKICVKERSMGTIKYYNYYWFYTNDLLQVGDTIHIGKK